MRIKAAVILLLVVGAALAVDMLVSARTLSPRQLTEVRIACSSCHSRPAFASADTVHARHPQVDCTFCHPANPPAVDFDACKSCHGIPRYESASAMHNIHVALNCSRCHGTRKGLASVDRLHNGLKWLYLGVMLFGVAVIMSNFVTMNRRTRVK